MSKAAFEELKEAFSASGRIIGRCSASRLPSLRAEFEQRRDSGELSSAIFDRYLAGFEYAVPERLPRACTLLVVAAPIGRSLIVLETSEGRLEAPIPPTYGAEELIEENEVILASILKASSFSRAWVPVKSLAARMGLARYGRDNVLRFEGMGSYVRLDAWWTELEADDGSWGPARTLERCEGCGACLRSCPNGCFTEPRFLVDATKCLTFLNEGPEPFPGWLDPLAHNAAVGCLRCQDACPENRACAGRTTYRRFALGLEASERLLAGLSCEDLPEPDRSTAAAILRASEMVGAEARLGRNLRVFAEAERARARSRA